VYTRNVLSFFNLTVHTCRTGKINVEYSIWEIVCVQYKFLYSDLNIFKQSNNKSYIKSKYVVPSLGELELAAQKMGSNKDRLRGIRNVDVF